MNKIEFLYFSDCPNYLLALDILDEVLNDESLNWPVEMILVTTQETAVSQKFLGSPSIRICGEDLEYSPSEEREYGLKCRIYQADGKTQGFPPEKLIRDAIQRAKVKNPSGPLKL
jgi:hypothetical protein